MKALALERTSAAKAGWVIAAIVLVWPVFLFLDVRSKPEERPVVQAPAVPSQLNAVGLRDNVDWDGMPEFFAVWSDKLDWKNDRTQFAYWNPGSNSYSYFFEAVRDGGKIRFRAISKQAALERKDFFEDSSGAYYSTEAPLSPTEIKTWEFRENSPTHPFVFFHELTYTGTRLVVSPDISHPSRLAPVLAPVELERKPLSPTDADTKSTPTADDPGKK